MIKIKNIKLRISNLDHITNSYIIYNDNKTAVVVDPADESQKIIDFLKENDLTVKYIFITHSHADHILALNKLEEYTNAKILVNVKDLPGFNDYKISCADILNVKLPIVDTNKISTIEDNKDLVIEDMKFKFIHTPGHTVGSMCIYEETTNSLFTGDTIFYNSYGRCDLITSSFESMKESLKKIFSLFDDTTIIYPGHGDGTTLKEAKKRINLLIAIKR